MIPLLTPVIFRETVPLKFPNFCSNVKIRSSQSGGLVEEEAIATGLQAEAAVGTPVEVVAGVRVRVHLQPCAVYIEQ